MRLEGADVTATELELRVVGAILGRGDALHELPAGFSAAVLRSGELRQAFTGLERLARAKRLPTGKVDHALVIAEAGLTDQARATLATAEATADDAFTRGTRIAEYALALLDRHRRSRTRDLLIGAVEALDKGAGTDDIVAGVTANLLDLDHHERPEVISYLAAAHETLDTVDKVKSGKARPLRTGFERVDRILRIRHGDLIVLGARAKIGKTTFARQVADTIALRRQHVLFHSLEMSVPQVVAMDLSRELSIDSTEFFDEQPWSAGTWHDVTMAADRRIPQGTQGYLHANHYYHSLGAILRISEKLNRKLAAETGKEQGLALVVVDYLQLVTLELGKQATREQVVATISRSLKSFAQRTGVPVLALAQLNREAAKRGERPWRPRRRKKAKKPDPQQSLGVRSEPVEPEEPETPPEDEPLPPPQIHDLRESGALEQDANAVCFIHHPFDLAVNPEKRNHGPFSFIVAAQRLGPKGVVKLYAEREFSRFTETD